MPHHPQYLGFNPNAKFVASYKVWLNAELLMAHVLLFHLYHSPPYTQQAWYPIQINKEKFNQHCTRTQLNYSNLTATNWFSFQQFFSDAEYIEMKVSLITIFRFHVFEIASVMIAIGNIHKMNWHEFCLALSCWICFAKIKPRKSHLLSQLQRKEKTKRAKHRLDKWNKKQKKN